MYLCFCFEYCKENDKIKDSDIYSVHKLDSKRIDSRNQNYSTGIYSQSEWDSEGIYSKRLDSLNERIDLCFCCKDNSKIKDIDIYGEKNNLNTI